MKKFKDHKRIYKLLNEIIPAFDAAYSTAAVIECKLMKAEIDKHLPLAEIKDEEINHVGGASYFKINFKEPVIQYVPQELQYLRHAFISGAGSTAGKRYVRTFIPSYIPNINHLALEVIYDASEVSFADGGFGVNKFTWDNRYYPVSIDTLNRLLRGHSQQQVVSNLRVCEKIRMCFEFGFWNLPDIANDKVISFDRRKVEDAANRPVIHNFIYDLPNRVVDMVVVRKTIAKIDCLHNREERIELVSSTKPVKAQLASVKILVAVDDKISTKTQYMYVTKNATDGIDNGDLINCVLAKSTDRRRRGTPFSYFVIIGKVDKKIGIDLKHFLAIYAWKKLQSMDDNNKILCRIGSVSEIRRSVVDILQQIDSELLKFIESEKSMNGALDNAIHELFPLFVRHVDVVYYNPPPLISHIANFYPDLLDDREMMLYIATLFDLFLNNYKEWGPHAQTKLRTSKEFDKMQTQSNLRVDFNHFLKSIPLIARRIVCSRLFSQRWKQ